MYQREEPKEGWQTEVLSSPFRHENGSQFDSAIRFYEIVLLLNIVNIRCSSLFLSSSASRKVDAQSAVHVSFQHNLMFMRAAKLHNLGIQVGAAKGNAKKRRVAS
jgi:hypothetical protein